MDESVCPRIVYVSYTMDEKVQTTFKNSKKRDKNRERERDKDRKGWGKKRKKKEKK